MRSAPNKLKNSILCNYGRRNDICWGNNFKENEKSHLPMKMNRRK